MSIEIILQDRSGQQLEVVDWETGRKLVKFGFAKVLIQTPCTIKLICKTSVLQELKDGIRTWKRIRRTPIYGNVIFQSCSGEAIFCNGFYKAFWYLARNLVEPVSEEPPTFRFLNGTNGVGNSGDVFYLSPKKNICVVCGCEHTKKKRHTRHHVLPHMFRRHMSDEIKGHSYHDIVILCKQCHKDYEEHADRLKEKIYKDYQVPLDKTPNKFLIHNKDNRARGLAWAILKHGPHMSNKILEGIKTKLQNVIDEPLTDDVIQRIAHSSVYKKPNKNYIDLGKWVTDRISDFQAFTIMWREHFVSIMKPQYMPEGWDVNKPIMRVCSNHNDC